MTLVTHSAAETMAFGERLGALLGPGDVVTLVGPLGAGKTTLTKGLAVGLGVDEPRWVTSPTFVLVHEYAGRLPVYHVDAYRLTGPDDAEAIGLEEMFYGDGVTVVEWADRILDALPPERLGVDLAHGGPDERRISLRAAGDRYEQLMGRLSRSTNPR